LKILKLVNNYCIYFKKPSNIDNFKNILVVSNTGLGDTILATPAIKTLRKSFPQLHITFMVNKKMFPLFKDFEYVDDFILYSRGFFNQLKIIKQLRIKNIDTIFLFHSNGPEDIFFSIFGGIQNILKMTNNSQHRFSSIFINRLNKKKQHVIENKIDLVRLYNPTIIDKTMSIPAVFYKQKYNYLTKKKVVGIQVGAQDEYKMWHIDNFITVIFFLVKHNFFVVLFGATKLECSLTKRIKNTIKSNQVLNLCGKSAIENLPSMVNSIDLLLTNDTGIMHLAISLKVPTLSLFGPTSSVEFGPYQDLDIHSILTKGNAKFVNERQNNFKELNNINNI
jgi:ADP-heptose:LPS heptosyltransferase